MKLSQIGISQFGSLNDYVLKLPPQGVTVIQGPNEAGKTTLRNFLHFMLFGLVDNVLRPYFNLTSKGGGVLEGQFANGEGFKLERYGYLKNKAQHSFYLNGAHTSLAAFEPRLSGATLALFRHIYAISLQELQDFSSITEETHVADKIFSQSLGMNQPLQAINDQLKAYTEYYYKPKATKPRQIQKLTNAWREKQARLIELQKHFSDYEALNRQINEQEQQLQADYQQLQQWQKTCQDLNNCIKVYDDYLTLKHAQAELKAYPKETLSPGGAEQLKDWQHTYQTKQQDQAHQEETLQKKQFELKQIITDPDALEQAVVKQALKMDGKMLASYQQQWQQTHEEMASLDKVIVKELDYLGLKDGQALAAMQTPLADKRVAENWQGTLQQAQDDYQQAKRKR
jgi:uncharacterized protein YhaN